MKSALRRTGLSADVLRAWETRYSAISPHRSTGGHRLYSEDDIERLILLQRLLAMGRRIGQLAPLRSDQLRTMLMGEAAAVVGDAEPTDPCEPFRLAALQQAEACDAPNLERTLRRGALILGLAPFLDGLVAPLLENLRNDDEAGPGPAQLAAAIIAGVLSDLRKMLPAPPGAARVLVATPDRSRDEVGLQLLAATAAAEAWDVVYLGAGLPADAIADAATRAGARVVTIWLSRGDASRAVLRDIRAGIPAEVALTASGPGAGEQARELVADGLSLLPERRSLGAFLESFR